MARRALPRWPANSAAAQCGIRIFSTLELPAEYFDGIFANASLFHVPSQELPRVLKELCATLKPNGVLFSSNPRGDNQEGWNGERYGAYYDWQTWRELVTGAGFNEIDHYYRPAGLPREQQPWLASVWRKPRITRMEYWSVGVLDSDRDRLTTACLLPVLVNQLTAAPSIY